MLFSECLGVVVGISRLHRHWTEKHLTL
jgi:hypothetical protein